MQRTRVWAEPSNIGGVNRKGLKKRLSARRYQKHHHRQPLAPSSKLALSDHDRPYFSANAARRDRPLNVFRGGFGAHDMLISNYRAAQSTIDSYAGVDRPRDSDERNKRLASRGCASRKCLDWASKAPPEWRIRRIVALEGRARGGHEDTV